MPKRRPAVAKRSRQKGPRSPATPAPGSTSSAAARWLLLIHHIPPKPDYLRVKIGRRLQRIGAVAIKNSVYVLPPAVETVEDFQWIVREIEEGGGDAFVSEASLLGDGLTDDAVRARFDAARSKDYRAILADARALLAAARRITTPSKRATPRSRSSATHGSVEHELAKLRRRYESVSGIDFFGASDGAAVAALLSEIHETTNQRGRPGREPQAPGRDGATWVTRRDIHVDRIGSAWLIQRFIDPHPRFRFVDPAHYAHHTGEFRFDMFEAEYTHVGDTCTFEALLRQFVPNDPALREIAEIVHDVDCKDGKFGRDEAPGLARMVAGIAAVCPKDEDRVDRGSRLFDHLYAAFGGGHSE